MTDLVIPTADQVNDAADVLRRAVLAGLLASAAAVTAPVIAAPAHAFDAAFYLATYPDIAGAVAANPAFDPAAHYQTYGRWEGRLPYKGAPTWTPTDPTDWRFAPAPQVVMPDVYAPAGATSVRIRVALQRFAASDPTPCERSFTLRGYAYNPQAGDPTDAPWINVSSFGVLTTPELLFLPSTGSQEEFVVALPAGQQGWFWFSLPGPKDVPFLAQPRCRVFVGAPPPAGYVYPDALPARTPTPEPVVATWDYDDALLTLALTDDRSQRTTTWCRTPTARQINNMVGYWPSSEMKTKSGATPDPFPIVDGARCLAIVDCRNDPLMDANGVGYPYAAPFISRVFGDGALGVVEIDCDTPVVQGVDAGRWTIGADGSWPPEQDNGETLGDDPDHCFITFHFADAPNQGFVPRGGQGGRHRWRVARTPDSYRQWRDGALIVECPNYHGTRPLDTILSIELGGQAAGALDPSVDYGAVRMPIHAVRYWAAA